MSVLFNKLLKIDTLHDSWKQIKSKNRGGGIDGITIADYDKGLHQNILKLRAQLKKGHWKPQPYLRMSIPKKENERRTLGILTINDKIVQQSIKQIVEPYFEKTFSNNSYGYRAGKGAVKAIKRLCFELNKKQHSHIVKFDFDNYFDNINRDILNSKVKEIIDDFEITRLIDLSVRMGVVSRGNKWHDTELGVPQGAVLSPLLANLYLNVLDNYFDQNNISYIRYADDFIAIINSEKEASDLAIKIEKLASEELKLKLNPSIITTVEQGSDFLGVHVCRGNSVTVNSSKQDKLYGKINNISLSSEKLTEDSIMSLVGIKNYYGRLLPDTILEEWDKKILTKIEDLLTDSDITDVNRIKIVLKSVPFFLGKENIMIPSRAKEISSRIKETLAQRTKQKNKKLVSSRKLEYQRREADGLDLVINSYGHSVGLYKNCVVVRKDGRKLSSFGNNLRHITILSEGVNLSSNLIGYCAERSIPIDFFDSRFKHICTLMSERFMHCSHWEVQSAMSIEKRLALGKIIIYGKIRNQRNLIKYYHKYHKRNTELVSVYESAIEKLDKLASSVKSISAIGEEKYQQILQGLEAQAAVHYWDYIRQLIEDDDVDFESREHKGATDIINSMLNYGYALLYPRVWQAILACKLNPYMGIIHYQGGKPALLYDIIELFRTQAVDRVVISLVQRQEPLKMDDTLLSDKTKQLLTKNVFERIYAYEKYRGKSMRFEQIIKEQVSEIAEYIVSDKFYRPYIAKW